MKNTYTRKEVIRILESISEGLAENIVCVEEGTKQDTNESHKYFNMGLVSGLEIADGLVLDTLEEIE